MTAPIAPPDIAAATIVERAYQRSGSRRDV